MPLELLASYMQVMERWQLEEPVGVLIRRLVDRFEPRAVTSGSRGDPPQGDKPPPSNGGAREP